MKRAVETVFAVEPLSQFLTQEPHPPGDIAELSTDVPHSFPAACDALDFSRCGWFGGNTGGAECRTQTEPSLGNLGRGERLREIGTGFEDLSNVRGGNGVTHEFDAEELSLLEHDLLCHPRRVGGNLVVRTCCGAVETPGNRTTHCQNDGGFIRAMNS
jgi:hypothetical protein